MIHGITCRRVVNGLLMAVAGITLLVMLCWKPLVTWQIESLHLPEGCVTVHPANENWDRDNYVKIEYSLRLQR